MKSIIFKALVLLLAVFMLLSAIACTPSGDGNPDKNTTTTVGGDVEAGTEYDSEDEGNPLSSAIYERMLHINEHLGVTIKSIKT